MQTSFFLKREASTLSRPKIFCPLLVGLLTKIRPWPRSPIWYLYLAAWLLKGACALAKTRMDSGLGLNTAHRLSKIVSICLFRQI